MAGASPAIQSLAVRGTGFFVDKTGIAVTAKHVIQPWLDALAAFQAGGPRPARPKYLFHPPVERSGHNYTVDYVVGNFGHIHQHPTLDVAVLTTLPRNPKQVAVLSIADTPCEEGDEVAICGYPFGNRLHRAYESGWVITPSFSSGIVGAVIPFPGAPADRRVAFQVDAVINGGNSGGPVFNPRTGRVVGIVVSSTTGEYKFKALAPGQGESPPIVVEHRINSPTGLGQAIPIHHIEHLVKSAQADKPQ
jgi:hypothetical protein